MKNYINSLNKAIKESENNLKVNINNKDTTFNKDSKIIIDQYIDNIEFSKDGVIISTELGNPIIIPSETLTRLFNAE